MHPRLAVFVAVLFQIDTVHLHVEREANPLRRIFTRLAAASPEHNGIKFRKVCHSTERLAHQYPVVVGVIGIYKVRRQPFAIEPGRISAKLGASVLRNSRVPAVGTVLEVFEQHHRINIDRILDHGILRNRVLRNRISRDTNLHVLGSLFGRHVNRAGAHRQEAVVRRNGSVKTGNLVGAIDKAHHAEITRRQVFKDKVAQRVSLNKVIKSLDTHGYRADIFGQKHLTGHRARRRHLEGNRIQRTVGHLDTLEILEGIFARLNRIATRFQSREVQPALVVGFGVQNACRGISFDHRRFKIIGFITQSKAIRARQEIGRTNKNPSTGSRRPIALLHRKHDRDRVLRFKRRTSRILAGRTRRNERTHRSSQTYMPHPLLHLDSLLSPSTASTVRTPPFRAIG